MATQVITQAKVFLDSLDISGDMNSIALAQGVDAQDATTFGNDTKISKAGLKSVKATLAGLTNLGPGLSEEFIHGKLRLLDVPLTVAPTTGAEGEPAWSFLSTLAQLTSIQGAAGDILKTNLEAEASSSKLVRGTILKNGSVVAGGNGTAFQLGNVAAGQSIYGALHVLSLVGGGTFTAKIQSATDQAFTTPVDRVVFTGMTLVGSQFLLTAGAITAPWWRVVWTLTGSTPSALFVVNAGIL